MDTKQQRKVGKRSRPNSDTRCILLFDLDCFYAQSMCRRLGYDAQTTPLALFQWNSVLAVTYPARKLYQIQRGDSWEAVHQKSQGQCLGVHVPILTTTAAQEGHMASPSDTVLEEVKLEESKVSAKKMTLQDEYRAFYCLSDEQQQIARRKELGVRKYSTQGKACIECFRIASATILDVVQTTIDQLDSRGKIVIERASIDEFFVDVTHFCHSQSDPLLPNDSTPLVQCIEKTVNIASELNSNNEERFSSRYDDEQDCLDEPTPDHEIRGMQYGCAIAHFVRKAVYDTLGFTMSAGIGPNKTLAKLAASYGKPAGQAVVYPFSVSSLLDATPIRKCRHFGGKVGKMVEQILPQDIPKTIGSIAQHLSLPMLRQGLRSEDLAQKVFDLARGIDLDPVESKTPNASAILTKSITAFKSLNFAPTQTASESGDGPRSTLSGHTIAEAAQWIELLAKEIVSRVQRDTQRNARYPRNCTIQYHAPNCQQEYSHQNNKSIRLPFPSYQIPKEERIKVLVSAVPSALHSKFVNPTTVRLHRIGLCATDFESLSNGKAISSYFAVTAPDVQTSSNEKSPPQLRRQDDTFTFKIDSKCDENVAETRSVVLPDQNIETRPDSSSVDHDLELARKLQATYDREERSLQVMEQHRSYIGAIKKKTNSKSRWSIGGDSKTKQATDRKISSFFTKK